MGSLVADAMVTIPKTHPPEMTLDQIRELFEDDHVRLASGDGSNIRALAGYVTPTGWVRWQLV
jgi:hypothetical protein